MANRIRTIQRFEAGGATLVAETFGKDGDEIIFLHGWGTNRESMRDLGYLFHHTHRIHLIDLPGFGEAPLPPSDWDTEGYAGLVQRYLRERVNGPFILVGHSFGGRLVVRIAAAIPHGLRGVVMIGVPGLPQPSMSRRHLRQLVVRWLRKGARVTQPILGRSLLDWHTRRYASRDYLAAGAMRNMLVRVVNEDLTNVAARITCSVLLLWGTDDNETPIWLAQKYRALMNGNATLTLLPHKDHYPFSGIGAHLCAFKIGQWMRKLPDA